MVINAVAESYLFEEATGAPMPLTGSDAVAVEQRHLNVFQGRRAGQEVEVLEDQSDTKFADIGPRVEE